MDFYYAFPALTGERPQQSPISSPHAQAMRPMRIIFADAN
jgi:hypothetical protein